MDVVFFTDLFPESRISPVDQTDVSANLIGPAYFLSILSAHKKITPLSVVFYFLEDVSPKGILRETKSTEMGGTTYERIYCKNIWGKYCDRFPGGSVGKESTCWCRRLRRHGFSPGVGKILWRRKWQPTPVFLPGKFHGQKSLAGYSPQGPKELDNSERLSTHALWQKHEAGSFTEGCLRVYN